MKDYFKQCRFKKGTHETIAFIPEDAAKVGNEVQLLTLDGEFWTVTEASEKSYHKDFIKENDIRNKKNQAYEKVNIFDQKEKSLYNLGAFFI